MKWVEDFLLLFTKIQQEWLDDCGAIVDADVSCSACVEENKTSDLQINSLKNCGSHSIDIYSNMSYTTIHGDKQQFFQLNKTPDS